jgi:hypothetical protein
VILWLVEGIAERLDESSSRLLVVSENVPTYTSSKRYKSKVSFAYDTQLRTLLGSHSHFLGVAWLDYLGSFGFTGSPLAAPTAELFVESDYKLIVTVNYFLKLQGLVLELASYLCDSGDINKDV